MFGHIGDHDHIDYVVVTGDVADHGRPEQYEIAAEALSRFSVDVKICPGNHDFDQPLRTGLNDSNLSTPRVLELGSWAFLFADSNAGAMVPGDDGELVDPPGEDRLHNDGVLGHAEAEWIRDACATTDAEHVFIWLHHPPSADVPALSRNLPYAEAWTELLEDLPTVRGLGGGHTHVPASYETAGKPVIVAPSLKNNFDLDAMTWLPPGYRTYEFGQDGSISSDVHLVDHDDLWPRRPMGRAIRSLFSGELTYAELAEIVARRQAAAD